MQYVPCHAKTGLLIFVDVIRKEDLAVTSPAKPFHEPTYTLRMVGSYASPSVYNQCHTKRKFGWACASQASFWYCRDKDLLKDLFLHGMAHIMLSVGHGLIAVLQFTGNSFDHEFFSSS